MTRYLILSACVVAIAGSSTLSAQHWGQERVPREGACFFRDTNFRGDYFCLSAGDALASLSGDANDRISSIRIFGRADVTVFKDARFSGDSTRFAGDVRNLKDEGWNDRISSVRVRSGGGGSFTRPAGDVDQIIRRAYRDVLDREPDQQGMRLYRRHMLEDGWSEERVRETLRNSPEYHTSGGMTVAKAQEVVRRAYLAVLKREPDPASQPFVEKVMRDHWSQQDVERELRKSDEYRRKR